LVGLWDLAGWVKEDARLNRQSSLTVESERLDFFTMTAGRFAGWIHRFFPEASFYWRYLHHVAVPSPSSWTSSNCFQGDPAADFHEAQTGDQTPRSPFHDLRIQQMNNAYNTVVEDRPFLNRFSWGELLTGHSYTFDDPIYPSRDVGGVLFADMMLYYMSQLPPKVWDSDGE
jgi:hypothetical protein